MTASLRSNSLISTSTKTYLFETLLISFVRTFRVISDLLMESTRSSREKSRNASLNELFAARNASTFQKSVVAKRKVRRCAVAIDEDLSMVLY
jgi:hypothetical protein